MFIKCSSFGSFISIKELGVWGQSHHKQKNIKIKPLPPQLVVFASRPFFEACEAVKSV